MRNCGEILEREIQRKKVERKTISEFVGIYPQNLSKYLRKESLDAGLLEKFCQYLNLDPANFFDYRPDGALASVSVGGVSQNVGIGAAQVNISAMKEEMLLRLLEEKDKRIKLLEEHTELLKNELSRYESENHNSADA